MKKTLIIAVLCVLVVFGFVFFYFGFNTYFTDTVVSEEMPAPMVAQENVVLPVGTFVPIDVIHKGSGDATIFTSEEGKRILRFEDNFEVTNGPDLYVYLSTSKTPSSGVESLGDFIDLGLLKGNKGSQNYEIPEGYEGHTTAVIWCKKYGVLFSYAVIE